MLIALESREDVERQLQIAYGDRADKLTSVISREEYPDLILVHVSPDHKIKGFYPRFSKRLYPGEDSTLPRTSFSPSVLQGQLGRGSPLFENTQYNNNRVVAPYCIYTIEWMNAIIPSTKLVPDRKWTEEFWVIPDNPNNRIFMTKKLGFFFLSHIGVTPLLDHNHDEYTFYFDVREPYYIIPGYLAKRGFYKVTVKGWKDPELTFTINENTEVETISQGEYNLAYVRRFRKSDKK